VTRIHKNLGSNPVDDQTNQLFSFVTALSTTVTEWILGKWSGELWYDQDGGKWVGCCDHGNEPSGSVKGEEFID